MSSNNIDGNNVLGVFGGTFDPIHKGHIFPALDAAKWLGLNKLLLLPAHIPPHKSAAQAESKHREAMVNLVCLNNPLFKLDNRELIAKQTSYTIHTLENIKKEHPNTSLLFFIGMDSLLSFTTWRQWEKILTLSHLIVFTRPGYNLSKLNLDTQILLKQKQVEHPQDLFQRQAGSIILHSNKTFDISSTEIRKRLSINKKIDDLCPTYIEQYIETHQLYRD